MANDLHKRWPFNTAVNTYWLPTIGAVVELNHQHPGKAIEELQAAFAYELGQPWPQTQAAGTLYPVYIRGQAYIKGGNLGHDSS